MTALAIIGAAFGLGYALVNFPARMSPLSIGEALWWGDAEALAAREHVSDRNAGYGCVDRTRP